MSLLHNQNNIDLSNEENWGYEQIETINDPSKGYLFGKNIQTNELINDANTERTQIGICSGCGFPIFSDSIYNVGKLVSIGEKNYRGDNITIFMCEVCSFPEYFDEDRNYVGNQAGEN